MTNNPATTNNPLAVPTNQAPLVAQTLASQSPATTPHNLAAAGQRINSELVRKKDDPMTLTPGAGEALEEAYADFLGDVGIEAIRLARRDGLENVDRAHVEAACRRIGTDMGRSRLGSVLSTGGGVVAGAGATSAYSVLFPAGVPTTAEWITALLLTSIGFVILTVGITLMLTGKSD